MTERDGVRSMGPLDWADPRSRAGFRAGAIAARLFEPDPSVLADRYEVRARIGSGGMGVVDEAFDRRLCRRVAIKRLHPGTVDVEDLKLLQQEAQALATLTHPNVVPVFDLIAHDGAVAMVMEFVEGTSLSAWFREPPSMRRRLDALRQAAAGLQAAHDRQLVHGDFKPSNVLIDRRGRVRLCDFGLASSIEATRSRVGKDDARFVWGTPRYMSPEQHSGSYLDGASDQYSFCVAAWILLTGQLPFEDSLDPQALADLKRQGPPPYPSASEVPARVLRALRRGLEPDTDDRWPSMMSLRRELQTRSRRTWTVVAGAVAVLGPLVLFNATPVGSFVPAMTPNPSLRQAARSPDIEVALALVRDGHKSRARALLSTVFNDAGARGSLEDVVESAAWLALLAPGSEVAEIDQAARDASIVVSNIEPSARTRALADLAAARAMREREAPDLVAKHYSDALVGVGDPLIAHIGERHLAMILYRSGRFDEGLTHLDRAMDHAKALGSESLAIETQMDRSQILDLAGRVHEAKAVLLSLLPKVDAPGPRANILVQLASLEYSDAQLELAQAHFEEAQKIIDSHGEFDTMLTLRCLLLESDLQTMQLEFDEALATLARARILAESSRGAHDRASMVILSKAANLLKTTGEVDAALEHLEASLALTQTAGNWFETAHTQIEIASVLADAGRIAEAQPHIEAAGSVVLASDEHNGRFVYETVLAKIREERGDLVGALQHYRTARRWFETGPGPHHPVAGMLLSEEARLAGLLGEDVDDQFEDAIAIQREGGSLPMIYGFTQIAYAQYLWGRGHRARARGLFEEALRHVRKHPGPPPEYIEALAWLADNGIEIDV